MKILITLHLAYIDQWHEIKNKLHLIPVNFDLSVTLIEEINDLCKLSLIEQDINNSFPDASIYRIENRGADLGGFFYSISRELEKNKNYDIVIKLHTKKDNIWRNKLFNDLLPSAAVFARVIDQFNEDDSMGMYGSYLYPYDYYNIKYVLHYCRVMGLSINTSWDKYKHNHHLSDEVPLRSLIDHSLSRGSIDDRPDIDEAAFLDKHASLDSQFNEEHRQWFIENGLFAKLPYYPGTMYWIRFEVLKNLQRVIDLEKLFYELEIGYEDDGKIQKITHAWERLIPMYAQLTGFSVWQSNS